MLPGLSRWYWPVLAHYAMQQPVLPMQPCRIVSVKSAVVASLSQPWPG